MRRSSNFTGNNKKNHRTFRAPSPSIHRRDYLIRKRKRRVLSILSISLLMILSCTGLLLSSYIGQEFALIMSVTPLVLLFVWLVVIMLDDEEPTIENSHHFQQVTGKLYASDVATPGDEFIAPNLMRISKDRSKDELQSNCIVSD